MLTAGQTPTNFGFYDGRMFSIDDPVATGFGAPHAHGGAGAFGGHGGHGGHGDHGGTFLGFGGGAAWRPGFSGGLPRCPAVVCPLPFVAPQCRYTPVMRTTFGTYCLGCTEDICDITDGTFQPRQRRRRRRIRRRLCRQFGICTWNGRRGRQFVTPRF